MIDRDVVNALHLLYWRGEIKCNDLLARLWCGFDSAPAIKGLVEEQGDAYRLGTALTLFMQEVEGQLANMPRPDFMFGFPLARVPREPGEKRPSFVAMPYGPAWSTSVQNVIVDSALKAGFVAEVSKDLATPGPITDQIWQGIRQADVIVADISGHNPNVFYELGLARALGKEVILIADCTRSRAATVRRID